MKENVKLEKTIEKLRTMKENEYMDWIANFAERASIDYNLGILSALGRGRVDGLEKGIAIGEKKLKKAKLEIAKKLLKRGIEINIIMEATGLTEKEIQEIQVIK